MMMYQDKLVAAIKVNGKVLREQGDTVTIPFGSEYSVLLKNLNSVRVQAKVSVDGKDATEGTWLIIEPNSSLELERFIKNGNLDSGNKLKFIERTKVIEDHRGIKEDDGIVRIEYKTERKPKVVDKTIVREHYVDNYHYWDYYWPYHYWPYTKPCTPYNRPGLWMSTLSKSSGLTGTIQTSSGVQCMAMNSSGDSGATLDSSFNDSGITVPGSKSEQKFTSVSGFDTYEQSQVLVIRLRGEVKGKPVSKPVFVATKLVCETCGKTSGSDSRFCNGCGTALEIV
jgi:hypothetical protein